MKEKTKKDLILKLIRELKQDKQEVFITVYNEKLYIQSQKILLIFNPFSFYEKDEKFFFGQGNGIFVFRKNGLQFEKAEIKEEKGLILANGKPYVINYQKSIDGELESLLNKNDFLTFEKKHDVNFNTDYYNFMKFLFDKKIFLPLNIIQLLFDLTVVRINFKQINDRPHTFIAYSYVCNKVDFFCLILAIPQYYFGRI